VECPISAYVFYDSEQLGRIQGEALLDALDALGVKASKRQSVKASKRQSVKQPDRHDERRPDQPQQADAPMDSL
jgi:hypothetical protein